MAKCKYCEQSGWLVSVNTDGLCTDCQRYVVPAIISQANVVMSSLQIVETSRNPATVLSRLKIVKDLCDSLEQYCIKNIPTINPPPPVLRRQVIEMFETFPDSTVDRMLTDARTAAASAATDAARIRPFASALTKLDALAHEFPECRPLHTRRYELQAALDTERFKGLFRKGELSEAQGKPKKAVEHFIAAMVALRHDSTDDILQADLADAARARILSLGGSPPY